VDCIYFNLFREKSLNNKQFQQLFNNNFNKSMITLIKNNHSKKYVDLIQQAYQGLLFELMTSDKHKSTPQTINELVEMDYTIYATRVLDYYDLWLNGERK